MAKKKRRKNVRIKKQLQFELLGLLFIFLSIFGSGASMISDGFIPTSLENILRLLLGVWYFIASIFLLVIGVILVIKRRFPTVFTKRMVGFSILFLGILLYTHIQTFERLIIDIADTSVIKATWGHFIAYINGQGVSSQLGGGMIGGILLAANYYLFSAAGAKIVAVFSVLIGFIFMTNLSIGNFYLNIKKKLADRFNIIKDNREKRKKEKQASKNAEITEEEESIGEKSISLPLEEPSKEVDVQFSYDETENGQLMLQMEEDAGTEPPRKEESDKSIIDLNTEENDEYELPPVELLTEVTKHSQQQEKSQIHKTVQVLEQTFDSFGVKARITKAHVGPAVTKYEVYPEAGVKVSKILSLHDDLALALAAQDIRIEAPIPGKSADRKSTRLNS